MRQVASPLAVEPIGPNTHLSASRPQPAGATRGVDLLGRLGLQRVGLAAAWGRSALAGGRGTHPGLFHILLIDCVPRAGVAVHGTVQTRAIAADWLDGNVRALRNPSATRVEAP
jgi:hypothetical protein